MLKWGTNSEPSQGKSSAKKYDFARVAKRISSWSSNLLATALILLAGLVFGRQILAWWQTSQGSVRSDISISQATEQPLLDAQPHTIMLGKSRFALNRQIFHGSRDDAFRALRDAAKEILSRRDPSLEQMSDSESNMLGLVRQARPVEQQPGKWEIFQLDAPTPLVVSTRWEPSPGGETASPTVAAPVRRVVSWGLGVPNAGNSWSLFTRSSLSQQDEFPEKPPPPADGEHLLSLSVTGGESLVSLAGTSSATLWKDHFESWYRDHRWQRPRPWQGDASGWHARFEKQNVGTVEVQIFTRQQKKNDKNKNKVGAMLTFVPQPTAQNIRE